MCIRSRGGDEIFILRIIEVFLKGSDQATQLVHSIHLRIPTRALLQGDKGKDLKRGSHGCVQFPMDPVQAGSFSHGCCPSGRSTAGNTLEAVDGIGAPMAMGRASCGRGRESMSEVVASLSILPHKQKTKNKSGTSLSSHFTHVVAKERSHGWSHY